MSYAVRNTIILFVTLFIIGGAAYAYIEFIQSENLTELEATLREKKNDFNSKKATSDSYPELKALYDKATEIVDNYDKALYQTDNPDDVYDYLNELSSGNSLVYFGYTFSDSLPQEQYGVLRSRVNGIGRYTNLVRFVNKLENSQLINKVINLNINPVSGSEEYSEVSFGFILESYYSRGADGGMSRGPAPFSSLSGVSTHNPFYPLIRATVPPNEDNLVNIESSRLIGLSGNRIFIIDQNGTMTTLSTGDKVYLGTLQSIDTSNRTATFNLNKGGITELFTLEIAQ